MGFRSVYLSALVMTW